MTAWLVSFVHWPLTAFADALRWASDNALGRVNGANDDISNLRNDLINLIWWWFTSVIPDWVPGRDWVRDIMMAAVSRTFDAPLTILERVRDWFWDNRDWGWGEWAWVARVLGFRESLKFIIEQIGNSVADWVGARLQGAFDWVNAALQGVRDWVGAIWQGFVDWVGAALQGVRDWAEARLQELRDWVGATWTGFWDQVGARLQELRDWVGATIANALLGINDWIANAQKTLDWVDDAAAEIQAFRDDPAAWLWARWERHLWPYVESWLVKVWDGVF
mgnify:FL=1